tara:strand:+ start:9011 stop:9802 length:792 start_codon:yes stop_codon:yes gene_type:complete
MQSQIEEAKKAIYKVKIFKGKTAIILGSGLGTFSDAVNNKNSISYSEIPNYPKSKVPGHSGELVIGEIYGKEIIIARGRSHCYEGYSKEKVTFPVHLFKSMGVENIIITNSSGSLKIENEPGTLVAIDGHLDCTFQDGTSDPDLVSNNKFYSKKLFSLAKKIAKKNGIYLKEGIYCWTFGPMYETPSEIKYLQSLNGTSVGMSTVPEVLEGGELGLNLLTITMLTNFAAGISGFPLTHDEVLYNAERGKNKFIKLVSGIIERI